ncbi:MAG TPA: transporter [Burkholderiaceae bacterium]|nr:transporter [Burkholderiaceae bacterium]
MRAVFGVIITALGLANGNQALACATCGCSLSSDGALGYATGNGWGISIDESFINQNQLRTGRGTISQAQVQTINGQEVENQTTNRYLTLGLSYAYDADWNFKLLAPYIDRSHTTYGTDATLPLTSDQLSNASVTGLGDIKLIASYQGLLATHNLGLQFGVKLPTGDYGGPSVDNANGVVGLGQVGHNPVAFGTSGNSGSVYLDTSLQAGNGSTDLIFGAYYFQAISQDFDAFINGQFQFSAKHQLDQAGADFRPGNQSTVSFGVRYEANPQVVPQLQINITSKSSDQGRLADTADTSGTVAYLSPGLSMTVLKNMQVYGFLQLPIYSQLGGIQLFPHYTATAGISYRF